MIPSCVLCNLNNFIAKIPRYPGLRKHRNSFKSFPTSDKQKRRERNGIKYLLCPCWVANAFATERHGLGCVFQMCMRLLQLDFVAGKCVFAHSSLALKPTYNTGDFFTFLCICFSSQTFIRALNTKIMNIQYLIGFKTFY